MRLHRDPAGHLRRLEVVPTPDSAAIAFAHYDYDSQGHLIAAVDGDGARVGYVYDERHLLTEHQRAIGITFYFRYDAAARCVETWGAYPEGRDPCLSDSAPATLSDSTLKAKGIHHCVFEYGDDGYSEVVDSVTFHRYFANADGKIDKAVSAGASYQRSYDENGHLASFTDPIGATTRWERDIFGNETREIDPLGYETRIERHPNGDIRRIVNPDGGVTEVRYGADFIAWVDPIGAHFQLFYDDRGLTTATVAPNGFTMRYVSDAHGNLTHIYEGDKLRRTASYDALGRLVSEQDASGNVTRYHYSTLSRLLRVDEADGSIWHYERDGEGNLIRQTDPEGRVTQLIRGGTGSLADAHLPDGSVVRLRYDRQERLIEVFNAAGEVYRIERDLAGLPVRETTFDGRRITRTYDLANRAIQIRRELSSVELERDLRGQIIKRTFDNGSVETFSRDWQGNLTAAEQGDCSLNFERNRVGWITREVQTLREQAFSVDYEYDLIGRPIARRTSLGHSLRFAWDDQNHQTRIRLDDSADVVVRRDILGRELERLLPGGGRVQFGYDARLRLSAERVVCSETAGFDREPDWVGRRAPGVSVDLHHEYSATSELLAISDAKYGTTRFDHDRLGQLVGVTSPKGTEARFRYDLARNLYDLGQATDARAYASGNQLLRKGDTEYLRNDQGRLEQKRERLEDGSLRVTRFDWNDKGLLSAVHLPTGEKLEFSYDPFARRLEKRLIETTGMGQVLLRTTRFVWSHGGLVHELETNSSSAVQKLRTYVFDDHGAAWAQRDASLTLETAENQEPNRQILGATSPVELEPWHFYINDSVGRPLKLVDAQGTPSLELAWTAWGRAHAEPGATTQTPIRWLGHYADAETGLHYNVHRYYDPEIGQYLAPDPLELLGGLNAYAYANNQPTEYVDPLGLIYSRIVRTDPVTGEKTTVYDGRGGRDRPPTTVISTDASLEGKPCAEREALSKMAQQIRNDVNREQRSKPVGQRMNDDEVNQEIRDRIKRQFEDEGLELETFAGKDAKDKRNQGKRVDPCPACGDMIGLLQIESNVVGAKGKKGSFGVFKPNQL